MKHRSLIIGSVLLSLAGAISLYHAISRPTSAGELTLVFLGYETPSEVDSSALFRVTNTSGHPVWGLPRDWTIMEHTSTGVEQRHGLVLLRQSPNRMRRIIAGVSEGTDLKPGEVATLEVPIFGRDRRQTAISPVQVFAAAYPWSLRLSFESPRLVDRIALPGWLRMRLPLYFRSLPPRHSVQSSLVPAFPMGTTSTTKQLGGWQ